MLMETLSICLLSLLLFRRKTRKLRSLQKKSKSTPQKFVIVRHADVPIQNEQLPSLVNQESTAQIGAITIR